MKTVEIVTHVWAVEHPHYASALVYQISSLILHEPKRCRVHLSVCHELTDDLVRRVLDWCRAETSLQTSLTTFGCCRRKIGRRCIGRNAVALSSNADIVWFADADQVFRDGVLDRLVETEWPEGASMIFPRNIKIHKDHATGDRLLCGLEEPKLVDVDPSDFVDKRYSRAIGGVQIVRGDFAREHGYLNGDEKWQRETDVPFGDFRDDVAYRETCLRHGLIVGVDLPGMYRLRHSRTTYQ